MTLFGRGRQKAAHVTFHGVEAHRRTSFEKLLLRRHGLGVQLLERLPAQANLHGGEVFQRA